MLPLHNTLAIERKKERRQKKFDTQNHIKHQELRIHRSRKHLPKILGLAPPMPQQPLAGSGGWSVMAQLFVLPYTDGVLVTGGALPSGSCGGIFTGAVGVII